MCYSWPHKKLRCWSQRQILSGTIMQRMLGLKTKIIDKFTLRYYPNVKYQIVFWSPFYVCMYVCMYVCVCIYTFQ